MIRIAWLFVGLIAATFLGVAAYDWLPDLFASGPRTSPERLINQTLRRDDVLPFAAIPALTGVIALILVPVGLAIADSAMGLYVLHRLRALREQKTKKGVEQTMTVKEFMTLFSGTGSLERMATEYTGSLYDAEILLDGKKAKVKLSRAGAAPHFHPGTLVDRSVNAVTKMHCCSERKTAFVQPFCSANKSLKQRCFNVFCIVRAVGCVLVHNFFSMKTNVI